MNSPALTPLNWQELSLFNHFDLAPNPVVFLDFQPKVQQALTLFQQSPNGSALVLKMDTLPEYFASLTSYFQAQGTPHSLLSEFNRQNLFGYGIYLTQTDRTEWVAGELDKLHHGVLILNLHALLLDITQWDKLKQALLFGEYEPLAMNALPDCLPKKNSPFKLLLVGNRDDIATLADYDDTLYQFAHYAEMNSYVDLADTPCQKWADYIQTESQRLTGKTFSQQGLNQLLNYFVRESESQTLISISPSLIKKLLIGLAHFYPTTNLFNDIQGYFDYIEKQASPLNDYALRDILTDQHYLDTDGETVGQINGLSVVEFNGVPHAFGEPIRISCNVQYGDGEIQDIERKVELGGNIHSKGIFLAQSCLANLLELPTQLPFSASIAFEQSYGEIDGDSSSLAIFCVLLSALSQQPLPQSVAVTGAIDQFGNVLSVGGVNQKIEGFFALCQARGLTGKQGVLLPQSCVSHLSLKSDIIEAVKAGQFHLWAVEEVFEAVALLFGMPFYLEDEPQATRALFELIHQQLTSQNEAASGQKWATFCKWRNWFRSA